MDPEKETIKLYHDKNFKPCDILKKLQGLKISKSKVYRTCKRLSEGQSMDNRHRSGRRRTIRTKAVIKRVRERIRRNPQKSANKLAKVLGISETSMRRILRKDLRTWPYKKRKVHGLTEKAKEKRLVRSKELLERHANGEFENLVFSDEKLFSVEETFNRQNNRIYALSVEDIPEEMRNVERFQHADKVMIWAAVSKKGKFPLVFVEKGIKINAEYYKSNILESVLKPHGDSIYPNEQWVFQQDSAPAHKAKISQDWCSDNLADFITSTQWPPSSPDLNPLDYSIWGVLEARVNATRHKSVESLKAKLTKEWESLSMDYVRAAIEGWPGRLRATVKAKGGRFE